MENNNVPQEVVDNLVDLKVNKRRVAGIIFLFVLIFLIIGGLHFYFNNIKETKISDSISNTTDATAEEQESYPYNFLNNEAYYSAVGGEVYYQQKLLVEADPESILDLGNRWAKDKNKVYWDGIEQEYLDTETTALYHPVFVVDKDNVWKYGTGRYQKVELANIDAKSFSHISWFYAMDNKSVYYGSKEIEGADIDSFVPLNTLYDDGFNTPIYSKDKDNVYYRGEKMSGVDSGSFVYLGQDYAKDDKNVYYQDKVIETADTASFGINESFGIDKNSVHYKEDKINIDINTDQLEVINRYILKDDTSVYYPNFEYEKGLTYKKMKDVDAQSFSLFGTCRCVEKSCSNYYIDKDSVFVNDEVLKYIDKETFVSIGEYSGIDEIPYMVSFHKDKDNIYRNCGEIIEGANPDTFEIFKDGVIQESIVISYPNEEEVFQVGDIINVRWKTIGGIKGGIYVELINEDGIPVSVGLGVSGPDLKSFNGSFDLNTESVSPGRYKIYMSTYGKAVSFVEDYSDNFFTIEEE